MIVNEDDVHDLKVRDAIGRHLADGFEDFCGKRVAVGLDPWAHGDLPRIVVHEDVTFGLAGDDAGPCRDVCNLAVLFIAGSPGGDTAVRTQVNWQVFVRQSDLFEGITEDEWWDPADSIPRADRRQGFRLTDFGDVQYVAAQMTIRTEIHKTERAN